MIPPPYFCPTWFNLTSRACFQDCGCLRTPANHQECMKLHQKLQILCGFSTGFTSKFLKASTVGGSCFVSKCNEEGWPIFHAQITEQMSNYITTPENEDGTYKSPIWKGKWSSKLKPPWLCSLLIFKGVPPQKIKMEPETHVFFENETHLPNSLRDFGVPTIHFQGGFLNTAGRRSHWRQVGFQALGCPRNLLHG